MTSNDLEQVKTGSQVESGAEAFEPQEAALETKEYDEAGLKELAKDTGMRIEEEEKRVFGSADKQVAAPSSLNIEQAKADTILHQGGFADRIQGIKDQITAFTSASKERITAIIGDQPERIASNDKTQVGAVESARPSPESNEQREREQIIEKSQEQRGNMLTNVLTSEVASKGLDLVPFAGGGKMVVESISGKTLSGQKLTGKDRVIHAAIGAGSLALDFTGIGEAKDVTIIAGKSLGLVEKLGARLAEGGAVRSAALFEKTATFMAKHPEAVTRAEQFAEGKLQGVIKQVKAYRGGERGFEPADTVTTESNVGEDESAENKMAIETNHKLEADEKAEIVEPARSDVPQIKSQDKIEKVPTSEPNVAEQNQAQSPDNPNANIARTVENSNPEGLKIQEQAKNLRASREVTDGKLFYAALKGNKEVFSAAHKQQMETDLAMAENKLAEYRLGVKQGESANFSLEESLKRDVEWRKNVSAGGKLESDSYMKGTQDGLKRIDGNFVKTEYPITDVLSRPYRNIKGEMQTGLIDALRTDHENYRKEFGDNALAETNYLRETRGVGLAALEAGDLQTAQQAFAFTESQSQMTGETKMQFEQIIGKMEPEVAKQLLVDLGITHVEPSVTAKTEQSAVQEVEGAAPKNFEDLKAGARQSREYREVKESLKREREISQPMIEEARQKRNLIMEKSGLLQMPEEEFNTYFSSKDFEVISDLKQQNVADCYLVASIHSMSRSPNFEMMVRSSMKRLPDGSWQVKVPFLSEEAKLVTITPEDLLPQKNEQFLKAKNKSDIIPDLRRRLVPLKGKEGMQVLEAAYMKSAFGKVDRLAAEGGFGSDPLSSFVGENSQKFNLIVSNDDEMKMAKDNPEVMDNPKFVSAYRKNLAKTEHFLENFDPEVYIATVGSKPGPDSSTYKVEGTNISLAYGHAYSITRFDAEKNMIMLANPWDTSKPIGLTIQQFEEGFELVSAVRIDNAKLMKNIEKINK